MNSKQVHLIVLRDIGSVLHTINLEQIGWFSNE